MDSFRKHLSIAEQQAAKEKKEAEKKKAKADKAKAEQAKKVPEVLADPNKVKPAPIRVSHIVHSTSCGRFALTRRFCVFLPSSGHMHFSMGCSHSPGGTAGWNAD